MYGSSSARGLPEPEASSALHSAHTHASACCSVSVDLLPPFVGKECGQLSQ